MSPPRTRPISTWWHNTTERLRKSPLEIDREHLLVGRGPVSNVYLPLSVLLQHLHVVGRSGGGKSAFLSALIAQLLRGRYGNVVVMTFKNDPALFHGALIEAKQAGYKAKWFGIEPYQSSYVFNPRQQSIQTLQTMREQIAIYLQALGLDHSKRQDLAFFGAMTETVFQTYMAAFSTDSLSDLFFIMDDPATYTRLGQKADWNHSRHISALLNRLGVFLSLNATSEQYPVQLDAQIDVVDALLNPNRLFFFNLPALSDETAAGSIARLFLFQLLSGATRLEGLLPLRPIFVIIDEFQTIVAEQFARIAEQSRGKLALILAHQALSQLRLPTGVDLAPIVARACGAQIIFDATDPEGIDYLLKTSPEIQEPVYSWTQPYYPGMNLAHPGALSPHHSLGMPREFGQPASINVSLERRPVLTNNDILRNSTDPNMAFVRFLKDEGFAQYRGAWQPTRLEYHIEFEEFKRRARLPWPPANPETIVNPLISPHQITLARGKEIEGPKTSVSDAELNTAFLDELRRTSGPSSQGRRTPKQRENEIDVPKTEVSDAEPNTAFLDELRKTASSRPKGGRKPKKSP